MNVAILGAGGIAKKMCATLRGMKAAGRPIELYAVGSRSLERAEAFAKEQGVLRAYGSYEEMLADPAVELVYVATPHSHHAEHMKLCIAAGKPILCEKAFTVNAGQAREVISLAREKGVYLAEAIWTRYMPSRRMIDELISAGEIGEPRLLTANLCYINETVPRLHLPELAGGALLDLGVYTLNFASMVFGDDIVSMESNVTMMPTGVDRTEQIICKYANGCEAHLLSSAAFNSDRRCCVYGTEGYITVDNCNNPQVIQVYRGSNHVEPAIHVDVPQQITGYEYEVEACLRDLADGALEPAEMPHSETILIMERLDALRAQWGMQYPVEA